MKAQRKIGAVLAGVALCVPLVATGTAHAATGCTASAVVVPGNVLVLSQENQERHPVLTTSCPLAAASISVLSSTDENVDFFDWAQNEATTGSTANWDEYAFTYVAGGTYHTDQSSYGLDSNANPVVITTTPFVAKDATQVALTSAIRKDDTVTVKGTSSQFFASTLADQRHTEIVVIEQQVGAAWKTVKALHSTSAGAVDATFNATVRHTYRLLINSGHSVETSTSAAKSA